MKNVIVDFIFKFGATVGANDLLDIIFDDTLMRNDHGNLVCFKVVGTVETQIDCTIQT